MFGDRRYVKLATIYKEANVPGYLFDNQIYKVIQETTRKDQSELVSFVQIVDNNNSRHTAIGHIIQIYRKTKIWLL